MIGMKTLAGVLLLAVLPTPAQAAGHFDGPAGWLEMCGRTPTLCNTDVRSPTLELDAGAIQALALVNSEVNAAIDPQGEAPGADVWQLSPPAGDCEDYALTKKQRLLENGWPASALRFATLFTGWGEYHAVLVVQDHEGGRLVLDNLTDEVLTVEAAEGNGYRLVSVEGTGPGGSWGLTQYGTLVALVMGL